MTERRYSSDEVAEIFRRAAEQQDATAQVASAGGPESALAPESGAGMTLADLKEIGREVGIPPELVAQAATSLDRVGHASVRRYLGLPIGVGRTVTLARRLTDAEWERLVVDLRQAFDARGRLHEEGSFKQWTNGNLQALLEPTTDGHQLRLKTLNGASFTWINTGLAMTTFAGLLGIAKMLIPGFGGDSPAVMLIGIMGLALFGLGAIRLPGWARERRRQMEEIAERLSASLSPARPPELPGA